MMFGWKFLQRFWSCNQISLDFLPFNGHLNVKTTVNWLWKSSWRLIHLSSLRCFKETQSPFYNRPKLTAAKHLKHVRGSVVVVFLFQSRLVVPSMAKGHETPCDSFVRPPNISCSERGTKPHDSAHMRKTIHISFFFFLLLAFVVW